MQRRIPKGKRYWPFYILFCPSGDQKTPGKLRRAREREQGRERERKQT